MPFLQRRILAYVLLGFVPVGLAVAFYFSLLLVNETYLVLLCMMSFLYVAYLLSGVEYNQKKVKRMVKGLLPPDRQEVILTTTQEGDTINMEILRALDEGENMSQTDISNFVIETGIELTHQMIREYILKLEEKGLIRNREPANIYAKNYVLTIVGQWYLDVFRILFPNRNLQFLVRHDLGILKLPKYPDESASREKSTTS